MEKQQTQDLQSAYDSEKAKLDQIKNTLGTSSAEYQNQVKVVDQLEKELNESAQAEDKMSNSLTTMRTQINNAEASVVKAENSLDSMNAELADVDNEADKAGESLEDAGDEAEKAGGKFEKLGTVAAGAMKVLGAALAAAAAGAVAIGKAAIENYADYEYASQDPSCEDRRMHILGLLMKGCSHFRKAVSRESFRLVGTNIFASNILTYEDKWYLGIHSFRRLLMLLPEIPDGNELDFCNNAAMLNSAYRFISDYQHKVQSLSFPQFCIQIYFRLSA